MNLINLSVHVYRVTVISVFPQVLLISTTGKMQLLFKGCHYLRAGFIFFVYTAVTTSICHCSVNLHYNALTNTC